MRYFTIFYNLLNIEYEIRREKLKLCYYASYSLFNIISREIILH